ncbi:CBS domain-containing protein [Caldivirga maquilingensis]|uniref:Putative signal transduction protein with CBS domains n=1 Tax=Caldivirga maquilingensis (strain ATCC 700844 / DSM 13496 / JCM 10307 / IC-167) TaxID=397948 RepID=A8MDU1_CALMQ|nr:CBS domain-containing protein [Caldivirga maquilingensis]ABW01947.1 putative signal transduction protein with CBS domains [Caldivirga maquilingensis IC-167]
MSFPPTYMRVVEALLELYNMHKRPIKSKEIADKLGMNEGTIRNIMVALKAMNLVDSKTGPYGGFIPSQKAVEFVKSPMVINPVNDIAQIFVNGKPINVYATGIELVNVFNPYMSKAIIKILGNVKAIHPGDNVRIGPTINARIIIEGIVLEDNSLSKELVIVIKKLLAIPKIRVLDVMTKELAVVKHDEPLTSVAKLIADRKIRALPVVNDNGELIGLITSSDLARAFSDGALTALVKDYMRHEVPIISWDRDIYDAMRLMMSYNIGRLIVINQEQKPVGIVTRTDILRYLAPLG